MIHRKSRGDNQKKILLLTIKNGGDKKPEINKGIKYHTQLRKQEKIIRREKKGRWNLQVLK